MYECRKMYMKWSVTKIMCFHVHFMWPYQMIQNFVNLLKRALYHRAIVL